MRTAGPRETWPVATCRTCKRAAVYVIEFDGRLHPHKDPHDGLDCHDHGDYRPDVIREREKAAAIRAAEEAAR